MILSDEEKLEVLAIAEENGLPFGGGMCGETALAIRDVLFGGQATLIAVANAAMYRKGRFLGHVGVVDPVDGAVWDARGYYFGDEAMEEFRAWGMLDPEDPDLWGHDRVPDEWGYLARDGEEEITIYLRGLSGNDVHKLLPVCPAVNARKILARAVREVVGRRPK